MISDSKVAIVGAGLAGCETAWQLARRHIEIDLYEMRPNVMTPAHNTGHFAELVCSNSLKSMDPTNAHGLLKAELELAGSLIIDCAKKNAVNAGTALAVDRVDFSQEIEHQLGAFENLTVVNKEVTDLEKLAQQYEIVVVAGGPLISESLARSLEKMLGESDLYFYDAIAPVVYAESIDMNIAFKASRYEKGGADYINCPINEQEYETLVEDLIQAKRAPIRNFEKAKVFEGCMPIEFLAERGIATLSYGPFKPVGLRDPRTGKQPWAVLQLRAESKNGDLYNMVGCQTRMTWPEQKRIFRKIPGLKQCEFARMGSMHRNSYLNAPRTLKPSLELKNREGVFVVGQLTGVEGYVESAASGMWAAINIVSLIKNYPAPDVDSQTMIGGLINYLQTASSDNFQPMNSNFGLLADLPGFKTRNKYLKRKSLSDRALEKWKSQLEGLSW